MDDLQKFIQGIENRQKQISAMISEIETIRNRAEVQADLIFQEFRERMEIALMFFAILWGLYIGYMMSHLNWN